LSLENFVHNLRQPVPDYLEQNSVLPMLLEHVENRKKEKRIDAPRLG
jgi:hypothetical protein